MALQYHDHQENDVIVHRMSEHYTELETITSRMVVVESTFFLLGSHQLQQDGKFAPVGLILIPSLKRRYIHPSLHGRSPPFWLRLRGPYLLENTVERSQHSTFLHSTLVQKLRFILVVYRPFCKYSHHGEAIVAQDHHMGRSGPRI